jgi:hypothetical protein
MLGSTPVFSASVNMQRPNISVLPQRSQCREIIQAETAKSLGLNYYETKETMRLLSLHPLDAQHGRHSIPSN